MEESKQEVEGVPLDGVMRNSWKWRMHSNHKIWNGDKSMDGIGRHNSGRTLANLIIPREARPGGSWETNDNNGGRYAQRRVLGGVIRCASRKCVFIGAITIKY